MAPSYREIEAAADFIQRAIHLASNAGIAATYCDRARYQRLAARARDQLDRAVAELGRAPADARKFYGLDDTVERLIGTIDPHLKAQKSFSKSAVPVQAFDAAVPFPQAGTNCRAKPATIASNLRSSWLLIVSAIASAWYRFFMQRMMCLGP